MAASIALNVLDSLCQVIVKEADLFLVVEDQVKTLGDQLKLMGSFLRDVERAESQEHVAMEELVIQIRDLTYEAEDIIEKYLVVARQSAFGFDRWNSKFNRLFTKSDFGRKFEAIRKQIEEICANKFGGTEKQQKKGSYVADNADVVGFHSDIEMLVPRLIEGGTPRAVVPIVGVGGLGKTTLAKKVFNLVMRIIEVKEIEKKFSDFLKYKKYLIVLDDIWRTDVQPKEKLELNLLGRNPQKKIENSFTGIIEVKEIEKRLSDFLKYKKYLIVLDDIWRTDVLEDLAPHFPDDNNGSGLHSRLRHLMLLRFTA
ncbi:putative disease resistance protein At1g50180 [Telopea speciosissima]|uniref:putative disease resistance protein At1g50180 n=1 Tax=Telopea speciosissima TaxID=54955 RepID=UPI001CC5B73A|nr:putative disease resistance protein At1g50180 [Telopea speciosissima]